MKALIIISLLISPFTSSANMLYFKGVIAIPTCNYDIKKKISCSEKTQTSELIIFKKNETDITNKIVNVRYI
ncbi:hypothetical protein [Photobacterium leiognathi]|uniref:hypothetical protein n=1 Tax=Photobacterium leiognathi TaxID=553611 RepID=UPI002980F1FC|nr:hypothetical protein [Photobacterium leiognathi]